MGSEIFIMVAFRCSESRHVLLLGLGDGVGVEGAQGGHVHHRGVDDLARQQGDLVLQDSDRAVGGHELDPHVAGAVHGGGFFAAVEILLGHVRHPGLGTGFAASPSSSGAGVFWANFFTDTRRAAVGVAFAQHRVDGRAEHLGEAGLQGLFLVGLGLFGIVRECRSPCSCSSLMASCSWGIEALMLGSLMMLASGVLASSPSWVRLSGIFWSSVSLSGKLAMIRPAREMSLVSTSTPGALGDRPARWAARCRWPGRGLRRSWSR